MIPHYEDYYWSQGKPKGLVKAAVDAPQSFKIISDPYQKHFSIERYEFGRFTAVVYDSYLFDFRLLKRAEEAAWQRETLRETTTSVRSLVRNMEERVILIEEAHFQGDLCRFCKIFSPHEIELATQRIFYTSLGDPFDGVLLNDLLEHPILMKRYDVKPSTLEFTVLLEEIWEHRT
jgi:hypothetical protein